MPNARGLDITKIDSVNIIDNTLSDITTEYPHDLQYTPNCIKLNHAFEQLVHDAPLRNKQINIINATELQEAAHSALLQTPAKYDKVQDNYIYLIAKLETFKLKQ